LIIEVISWILISFGTVLLFSASLALIRFADPYMKIHAGSKASFGGAVILLGFLLMEGITDVTGLIILLSVFMLITSPVLGHSLGRAAYLEELCTDDIKKISYPAEREDGGDGVC